MNITEYAKLNAYQQYIRMSLPSNDKDCKDFQIHHH